MTMTLRNSRLVLLLSGVASLFLASCREFPFVDYDDDDDPSNTPGHCVHSMGVDGPPKKLQGILMRRLSGGEGEQFRIDRSGILTQLEAHISVESREGEIVAEVFRFDGEEHEIVAASRVPASEFPDYNGIHGENRMTTFRFTPPVPVRQGELIDIVFRPTVGYAVSGIYKSDFYPGGQMVFHNGRPGLPDPVNWDYIMRICIR